VAERQIDRHKRSVWSALQGMGDLMFLVARLTMRLVRDEAAQDLIEYALLVGLVALVAVIGVTQVGEAVNNVLWRAVSSGLSNAL
jgi:Flp pilus assembly pilin Flp